MSNRKKKPKYGAGEIVRGEIVTLKTVDWSDTIDDLENWTRGPVLPVGAAHRSAATKKIGRSKKRRRIEKS